MPSCSVALHVLVVLPQTSTRGRKGGNAESRGVTDASSLRTFISLSLLLLFPRKLSPIGCSSAKPVASASASVHIQASRADRKSQVRQCLGFCTADFCSPLPMNQLLQKSQHCLAWDFSLPQKMIINTPLLLPVAKLPIRSRSMVNCWRGCVARQWCFQLLKTDTRWCSLSILNYLKRIKCQEAIILRVTKIEFF